MANQELNNAISLHQKGDLKKALKIYFKLRKDKDNHLVFFLIGTVLLQLKKYLYSIRYLEHSKKLNNKNLSTYKNLGVAYQSIKLYEDAKKNFKDAEYLEPNDDDLHLKFGNFYYELKKYQDAINSFNKAIAKNKENYMAYNNLANVYIKLKFYNDAIKILIFSKQLFPNSPEIFYNLGRCYQFQGDNKNAIFHYKKSIEIDSNSQKSYKELGKIYSYNNIDFEIALKYFLKAKEISNDLDYIEGEILNCNLHLCNWNNITEQIKNIQIKINKSMRTILPLDNLMISDDENLNQKTSKIFSDYSYKDFKRDTNFKNMKKRKISLAYFSSDFKQHAVGHLIYDIIKHHNKDRFDVFGFYLKNNKNEDDLTKKIKKHFTKFFNTSKMTNEQIISLCIELDVDIAIDLNGHTAYNRLDLFARGLGKIHVTYLGYPGTVGSNFFDYIIADETTLPKHNQKYYNEKVIYLSGTYQPNRKNRINIKKLTKSKKYFQIPEDKFIFCCFNANRKINFSTYKNWMKILSASQNSILWLMVNNDVAEKNLKLECEKFNIDPNRLYFTRPEKSEHYFNKLLLCDLFLDTYPYNAHTTATDALRVGLPILTLKGNSFASRVCASILKTVNCDELIAKSEEEYVAMAVEFSEDMNKFKNIKEKILNKNTQSIFTKSDKKAKEFEKIYTSLVNDLNI